MNYVVFLLLLCFFVQAEYVYFPRKAKEYFYEHNKYGYKKPGRQKRIIYGTPAHVGQFPYQAAILCKLASGYFEFCGGAIISSEWILTAAHCLNRHVSWTIKFGGIYSKDRENSATVVESVIGIPHDNFQDDTGFADIGVIKVNNIIFTSHVKPVALPKSSEFDRNLTGMPITITGWGATREGGPYTMGLKSAELVVLPSSECRRFFKPSDSYYCALGAQMESSCSGDGGGPAVATFRGDRQPTLVGIIAFGVGDICSLPVVHTRIDQFAGWLQYVTHIPMNS